MADETQAPPDSPRTGKGADKSVFLLLGGIVFAGIIAGYSWLKRLPKDR